MHAKSPFQLPKEQIISYILLALGLLFLLFSNFLVGGLMVGMVAGYHFSSEIVYFIKHLSQFLEKRNKGKEVTLLAVLVAFFIGIPSIFIGAIVVAFLKKLS